MIALRKDHPQLRRGRILWKHSDDHPRLVCYTRSLHGHKDITVYLNAGKDSVTIPAGKILYSRQVTGTFLLPGGIAVVED